MCTSLSGPFYMEIYEHRITNINLFTASHWNELSGGSLLLTFRTRKFHRFWFHWKSWISKESFNALQCRILVPSVRLNFMTSFTRVKIVVLLIKVQVFNFEESQWLRSFQVILIIHYISLECEHRQYKS